MLEFDIDSSYLTDDGEMDLLDAIGEVWLNDECGEADQVACVPKAKAPADTSDGYHTFAELYEHRTGLLAAMCNTVAIYIAEIGAIEYTDQLLFKSWHHHDGEMYEGMFIVGINCEGDVTKPTRWATWHCEGEWWDRFVVPELYRAPEWDGHTPADALARLVGAFTPME